MRRIIENAFGQLVQRFRRFLTILEFSPEKSAQLVLSAIILHNFLSEYNIPNSQNLMLTNPHIAISELLHQRRRIPASNFRARIFRERFVDFFSHENGRLYN